MTYRTLVVLANVRAERMKAMYGAGDGEETPSGRTPADRQKDAVEELMRLSKLQ